MAYLRRDYGYLPRRRGHPGELPPRRGQGLGRGMGQDRSKYVLVKILNLAPSVTSEDIENLCKDEDVVIHSSKVFTNPDGQSAGKAEVLFFTNQDAQKIITKYKSAELDGKSLKFKVVSNTNDRRLHRRRTIDTRLLSNYRFDFRRRNNFLRDISARRIPALDMRYLRGPYSFPPLAAYGFRRPQRVPLNLRHRRRHGTRGHRNLERERALLDERLTKYMSVN